jgi:hypothetical protein
MTGTSTTDPQVEVEAPDEGAPQGFLRQQPGWTPEGLRAETPGDFRVGDLLRFGTIGQ